MKRTKQEGDEKQLCFKVTVDGKEYGPFLNVHLKQFKAMEHLKGVQITKMWLSHGWITPPPQNAGQDQRRRHHAAN